jgi:carboxypeptidase family protein
MKLKAAKFVVGPGILVFSFLIAAPLLAQVGGAVLSGTVTDPSGKAVPSAKISLKNVATGQAVEAQADPAGLYSVPNLAPGEYEVSVSAEGWSASVTMVTIAAAASQTMNLSVGGELSLSDLGFAPGQTQGSTEEQARLDKRSHMLKIHQRVGLIAAVPLVATVIAGGYAGGRSTSSANRDLHVALGSVAGDLYGISAWYAIRAPRIKGTETRGPIKLHKILAWIHGPGMIMTPILGAMAFDQRSKGEKVHGIASAHGAVGVVTAAAYGLAILSVSLKF